MTFGKDKEKLMIYLLEDDGNIRKFVLYALKTVGIEDVYKRQPQNHWRGLQTAIPEKAIQQRETTRCLKFRITERLWYTPCQEVRAGL